MQERRRAILRKLEECGSVKVNDLSRELGCSEVTIRADIRAMEQEGKLTRTHGGAVGKTADEEVHHYRTESLYRNTELKKADCGLCLCVYRRSGHHHY